MIKASALVDYVKNALADEWGYIWGTSGIKWTDARQDQLEKTTDENRAMGRKYGRKWVGHMVADCSGLISGFFSRSGGKMVHGSDTMYRQYTTSKGQLKGGKRADGQPMKPGTAVFTYDTKKGKYGHVGVYIGNGLCIEAHGTQAGVITSKVTAWGYWGELKGLEYDGVTPPGPDPEPTPEPTPGEDRPTLRKGSRGEYVTLLQTELLNRGYALPKYGADGSYGQETVDAVKMFQRENGLTADGICGKMTWKALDEAKPMKLYTVTIQHLPLYKAEAFVKSYENATMKEEV